MRQTPPPCLLVRLATLTHPLFPNTPQTQVLPGQYAFVLHTASPFSGERGEMYGELVCGLGETLVGNHPGRPLAFSDKPDGSDMQVCVFVVLRCVCLLY